MKNYMNTINHQLNEIHTALVETRRLRDDAISSMHARQQELDELLNSIHKSNQRQQELLKQLDDGCDEMLDRLTKSGDELTSLLS